VLAWRHGTPIPRDEIAEVLWPTDPPGSWETTLSAVVSNLRRGLGDQLTIEHAVGCYQLTTPSDVWVDVEAAYGAVHEAEGAIRSGDLDSVYAWSGVATTITRRPFLAGEHGAWIEARRRELGALRIRALEAAVEFCVWNGEWGPAMRYAEALLDMDPLREASYRRLMSAAAASGDRAAAARAYERCRVVLAEELGVLPHPDTEALYDEILGA
jgi:DNA-binding SARP family transcriptional activator